MDVQAPTRSPIRFDNPRNWEFIPSKETTTVVRINLYKDQGFLAVVGYIFSMAAWAISAIFSHANNESKPKWEVEHVTTTIVERYRSKEKNKVLTDSEGASILRRFDQEGESKVSIKDLRSASEFNSPLIFSGGTTTHYRSPMYKISKVFEDGKLVSSKLGVFTRPKIEDQGAGRRAETSKILREYTLINDPNKTPTRRIERNKARKSSFMSDLGPDGKILDVVVKGIKKEVGLTKDHLLNVIKYFNGDKVTVDGAQNPGRLRASLFSEKIGKVSALFSETQKDVQSGVAIEFGRLPGFKEGSHLKLQEKLETTYLHKLRDTLFLGVGVSLFFDVSETGEMTLKILDDDHTIPFWENRLNIGYTQLLDTYLPESLFTVAGATTATLENFIKIYKKVQECLKDGLVTIKTDFSDRDSKIGFTYEFGKRSNEEFDALRESLSELGCPGLRMTVIKDMETEVVRVRVVNLNLESKARSKKRTNPQMLGLGNVRSVKTANAVNRREEARRFLDLAGVPNHSAKLELPGDGI